MRPDKRRQSQKLPSLHNAANSRLIPSLIRAVSLGCGGSSTKELCIRSALIRGCRSLLRWEFVHAAGARFHLTSLLLPCCVTGCLQACIYYIAFSTVQHGCLDKAGRLALQVAGIDAFLRSGPRRTDGSPISFATIHFSSLGPRMKSGMFSLWSAGRRTVSCR